MLRSINYLFFVFIIFSFTNVSALQTNWSHGLESQVRIISPYTHTNNENQLYLGLQYKLKEGWKTYWRSPGEGGFPQKIDWSASRNIQNIEILWPTPQEFTILGFKSLGYSNEVIFPLKTTIKKIDEETFIVLDINYLICKDICIPGTAHLELIIPAGEAHITKHSYNIEKSLSLIPDKKFNISGLRSFSTKVYQNDDHVSILIKSTSEDIFKDPELFLDTEFGLPVVTPEINFSNNHKTINANFVFDKKNISKNLFQLSVILKDNNKAFEFVKDVSIEKTKNILFQNRSIIYFFLVALIGGLILNVMPCVLPVLSIKLLSVLNNAESKSSIRKSFIITSVGIISSFGILALILIMLRSIGISIGWGMQFQQPLFLMIIAVILFLFTINIFGFFEFRTPSFINSRILLKLNKNNYSKDFFNGFFATILATPCSAPFVGTAITAAFTQSSFTMLGIFFCIGLGMALPYLLISLFPDMTIMLPKPGRWMRFVKHLLGFLLLATLVWIGSILLNHFNVFFIIATSILFGLTCLILKFYNKKLIIILTTTIIFFSFPSFSIFKFIQQAEESDWINLNNVNLDDYIQNNEILFVDITADWCATCQFNKINVLNSSIIIEIFEKNNIIKLRGDWTRPNKQVENFLQQHNRFGIPLNVIYSKSYPTGVILSELLTTKEIIDTLKKITKSE